MNKITVDKAIQKGHQMINYPIIGIMILGVGTTLFLGIKLENGWIYPLGFVLTFVLMWLWWSFTITNWRIWAFGNCRNVHELKRRAINEKLIWPDGSKYEKTEFRTASQRRELKLLERKFRFQDEPEIISDDGSIPTETKIYYSKISLFIIWSSGIILFVFGFYSITEGDIVGYFFVLLSIFVLYHGNKKASFKTPYLELSNKGIKTLNTSFVEWKNVQSVRTTLLGSGKNSQWYLIVRFSKRDEKGSLGDEIEISDLNMSPKKIDKLIKLYQQRNRRYQ